MPQLEIRLSAELDSRGLLGLLADVEFFPPESPDEVAVLEEENANVWGEPAVRGILVAAIAAYPSRPMLRTGLMPVRDLRGWLDFYAALGQRLPIQETPPQMEPGRFFPLRWVTEVDHLSPTSQEIAEVLTDDPDARRFLAHLVAELLGNALHHGEWERGALVGAQYFPGSERVQVAIVDCGQGIRRHLSQSPDLQILSDQEALDLALRPWVTGTAGQSRLDREAHGHVGCGLPMAAGLVSETDGLMLLASGDAGVRIDRSGRHVARIRPWRGTVVVMDVLRPRLRDFTQVVERVRKGFGPRPRRRPLRFG